MREAIGSDVKPELAKREHKDWQPRSQKRGVTSGRNQTRAAPGTAKAQRRKETPFALCLLRVLAPLRLCVKKSERAFPNCSSVIAPDNLSEKQVVTPLHYQAKTGRFLLLAPVCWVAVPEIVSGKQEVMRK